MRPPSPLAGEDGVVVVTVALWLPVLILFASFVIDVGNWFEHQRHLQLQADAGALAAASDLQLPLRRARRRQAAKNGRANTPAWRKAAATTTRSGARHPATCTSRSTPDLPPNSP